MVEMLRASGRRLMWKCGVRRGAAGTSRQPFMISQRRNARERSL